ncbi:MAG: DUF5721 family protein [Lachnospiraceae bacterium]|nr:DUF5721 family protein [Lachnospiraceae bacterium]
MSLLLQSNSRAFDQFLLKEAVIKTNAVFIIDGHINEGYYTKDELLQLKKEAEDENRIFSDSMLRWKLLKTHCLSIIKGDKTPTYFSFEFYLAPENVLKFLSSSRVENIGLKDIQGLCINIKYSEGSLFVTTAMSLSVFTLDKTLYEKWDSMVKAFFNKLSLSYEEL